MLGLYALRCFHVLWAGLLCGNGWYMVLILPKRYQYLSYFPSIITGCSYIVWNHRCCLSILEHHLYPEWTSPAYPVSPLVSVSVLTSLTMTHYTVVHQHRPDAVVNALHWYIGSMIVSVLMSTLHH